MSRETESFRNTPFRELVRAEGELYDLRQEFASRSPEERRRAAEDHCASAFAEQLFQGVMSAGSEMGLEGSREGMLKSLAIDPEYAPALLAVGSLEYQGRPEEAEKLFYRLLELPEDTEDWEIIVGEAVDFLIDENDLRRAEQLAREAVSRYPHVARYHRDLSYCLGEKSKLEEAAEEARRAWECDTEDPEILSDIGWVLVEAEYYEEAETILMRAVKLAGPGYHLPQHNLDELHRRMDR